MNIHLKKELNKRKPIKAANPVTLIRKWVQFRTTAGLIKFDYKHLKMKRKTVFWSNLREANKLCGRNERVLCFIVTEHIRSGKVIKTENKLITLQELKKHFI